MQTLEKISTSSDFQLLSTTLTFGTHVPTHGSLKEGFRDWMEESVYANENQGRRISPAKSANM